jgi:hypothetical protein
MQKLMAADSVYTGIVYSTVYGTAELVLIALIGSLSRLVYNYQTTLKQQAFTRMFQSRLTSAAAK